MALGGIAVTWNNNVPSVTSQAGVGYQDLQSIKSTMQQVFDSEHVFESTGGSNTGIHRKGSAVVFYGASSAISSTDTNGRLMIDSTNSRLFHVGSADTRLLGGQYGVLAAGMVPGGAVSKVTQMFGFETSFGTILNGSTGTTITLNNTWVSANVFVQANVRSAGNTNIGGTPFVLTTNGTGLISATNQVSITNCGSSVSQNMGTSATTEYGFTVFVFGIKAL